MTAASNSLFHDSATDGAVTASTSNRNQINFKFPTADKPLIVKLIKDLATGKETAEFHYYKHMVGESQKETRYHISRESLDLGRSPEADYYAELKQEIDHLKKSGTDRDDPQLTALFKRQKEFRRKVAGYLFYVEPNSPEIKALKCPQSVFNRLFGRESYGDVAAVPSLSMEMAKKGLYPYLDRNPEVNKTGWIKIWKDGEGLGTRYHLEAVSVEENIKLPDGSSATVVKSPSFQVSDAITAMIKGESPLDWTVFPNVRDFEKTQVWTEEESEELIRHEGGLAGTPDRVLKKNASYGAGDDAKTSGDSFASLNQGTKIVADNDVPAVSSAPDLDSIPF